MTEGQYYISFLGGTPGELPYPLSRDWSLTCASRGAFVWGIINHVSDAFVKRVDVTLIQSRRVVSTTQCNVIYAETAATFLDAFL